MKLIFIFCFFTILAFGQNDCYLPDTIFLKQTNHKPLIKKDYKKFKKDSCFLDEYEDNRLGKSLYCKSKYYCSVGDFLTSIQFLKQAYTRCYSIKLRYEILKQVALTYKLGGDLKSSETYQNKANAILLKFPELK